MRGNYEDPTTVILHMFNNDNSNAPFYGGNQTLGLKFSLDLTTYTATLLKDLHVPNDPVYVPTQGSFVPQSNGNTVMGYGQVPYVREYDPDGDLRLQIQFGFLPMNISSISYRTFRFEWTATPAHRPVLVADKVPGQAAYAYFSWNGATSVSHYDVYEGQSPTHLVKTRSVAKSGFETNATLYGHTKFVQIVAVDPSGRRKSNVASVYVVAPSLTQYETIIPGAATLIPSLVFAED